MNQDKNVIFAIITFCHYTFPKEAYQQPFRKADYEPAIECYNVMENIRSDRLYVQFPSIPLGPES